MEAVRRAKATCDYAGSGIQYVELVCRILAVDGESMSERQAAVYGPAGHRSDSRIQERPLGTVEAAARFVAKHGGVPEREVLADSALAKAAYRRASKWLHPDVGGDTRMMQRLTEANRILEAQRN